MTIRQKLTLAEAALESIAAMWRNKNVIPTWKDVEAETTCENAAGVAYDIAAAQAGKIATECLGSLHGYPGPEGDAA